MVDSPLTLLNTPALLIAACVATLVIAVSVRRRIRLSGARVVLAGLAAAAMVAAAGEPIWRTASSGEVAVLVDCSASTRTASYRDPATLERRLDTLLGDTPRRVYRFADGVLIPLPARVESVGDSSLPDLPSEKTRYVPPAESAVLLFSDGQFALPETAPPTFSVIDPNLLSARDGRITQLRQDDGAAIASLDLAERRALRWTGPGRADSTNVDAASDMGASGNADTESVPAGRLLRRHAIAQPPATIAAMLSPGDAWPENDALTLEPILPASQERWFVSRTAEKPPAGFRLLRPSDLPGDASGWLRAAVVVLDNLPADSLTERARDQLEDYVRRLGGGVVLMGGDRAFSAGGYVGTRLEQLSPLASVPPRPATHWMLLTDGSGSMNQPTATGGSGTRWQAAAEAIVRLLPTLPPDDPVDVGSFAARVDWWSTGASAAETARRPLPPADRRPGGPTGLVPAIDDAIRRHDPALPGVLLLLSDTDATLDDAAALAARMKARNIRLYLLALGEGQALEPLRRIAIESGGAVVAQNDAGRWATAAADLLAEASLTPVQRVAVAVRFTGPMTTTPGRTVTTWNRTFLKPRATELARLDDLPATRSIPGTPNAASPDGTSTDATTPAPRETNDPTKSDNVAPPLAAVWQAGEGRVAAAAFTLTDDERSRFVDTVARPPHDPRFSIRWSTQGDEIRVRVDAIGTDSTSQPGYLNGLAITLDRSAGSPAAASTLPTSDTGAHQRLQQTAPGRYELTIPASGVATVVTLRQGGEAIDRIALPGRYAPEFDEIGINRAALDQLASQTGGRVIEADEDRRITFPHSWQAISLSPWLAGAAAMLLLVTLVARNQQV